MEKQNIPLQRGSGPAGPQILLTVDNHAVTLNFPSEPQALIMTGLKRMILSGGACPE